MAAKELSGEISEVRHFSNSRGNNIVGCYTEYGMAVPIYFRFEQEGEESTVLLDPLLSGFDNVGEGPFTVTFTVNHNRLSEPDWIEEVEILAFGKRMAAEYEFWHTRETVRERFEVIVEEILNKFFDEHRVRVEEDDFEDEEQA